MKIIGLTGPAGCGKSTAAQYLRREHGFCELSFADPLKDMVASLMALPREKFDRMAADREAKEAPLAALGNRSIRYALQRLGTEWGRNLMHPDLWVIGLRNKLEWIENALPNEYRGIVISDVRFENEAKFVRERGQLVQIMRPDVKPIASHISESGITPSVRDEIILNCGCVSDLHVQLDLLLRKCHCTAAA